MNSALFFTLPQKMWNHRSLQPQNLFCFFIWFFFNTNAMNGLNLFNKILLKPDAVWKWEMFRFSLLKCAVSYQTLIKIYCILLETLFGEQIKILFEFFIQILLFIFFSSSSSLKINLLSCSVINQNHIVKRRGRRRYKIYFLREKKK